MELQGKCAIITGGADGFGKGLVKLFAEKGAKVVFGDIAVSKGQELANSINQEQGFDKKVVTFVECDVRVEEDLVKLFQTANKEFGGAQIVINNAGVGFMENITETTSAVDTIVDINLKAVIKGTSLAIQHFTEQMKKSLSGPSEFDFVIVNISSASAVAPISSWPIYSATKKGVMYFSQALLTLKDQNIRVNCALPRFTETNLVKPFENDPIIKQKMELSGGYVPLPQVLDAIYDLAVNKERVGDAMLISKSGNELLPRLYQPRV